jgi:hypothetical protein
MGNTGWFKSNRSTSGGENCVEVRLTELATHVRDSKNPGGGQLTFAPSAFATLRDTGWFKSSHSTSGSDNCVEVRLTDLATNLRDSKNPESGQLTVTPSAFAALVTSVR